MGDKCQKGYGRGLSDSNDTDVTNWRGLPQVIGITRCLCTENVQIVSSLQFKIGKKHITDIVAKASKTLVCSEGFCNNISYVFFRSFRVVSGFKNG